MVNDLKTPFFGGARHDGIRDPFRSGSAPLFYVIFVVRALNIYTGSVSARLERFLFTNP